MLAARLHTRTALARRLLPRQQRHQSTYEPPNTSSSSSSRDRHRDFYKTFGRPLAKNFLIAVATYQVLYFSWLKLESYETKRDGEAEVREAEGELRGLSGKAEGKEG